MEKIVRRLKKRKVLDGKNIEFKVERKIKNMFNEQTDTIIESLARIIKNIESDDYIYYVGDSNNVVEVINDEPKYLRSQLNESKDDNIDSLPTY